VRVEAFNVFNHPQFSGFSGSPTLNVCGNFSNPWDFTATANNPTDAQRNTTCRSFATFQNASASAVQLPNGNTLYPAQNVRGASLSGNPRLGNGLGEFNGLSGVVTPNRVIQLAVKIYF